MWNRFPELHARITRSWHRIRGRLDILASKRWRRVRGPIGAVVATLLDVGWKPVSPVEWHRPVGDQCEVWQFPDRGNIERPGGRL
eukprot:9494906-Pyramimonas_sp.AAC.1